MDVILNTEGLNFIADKFFHSDSGHFWIRRLLPEIKNDDVKAISIRLLKRFCLALGIKTTDDELKGLLSFLVDNYEVPW